MKIIEAINSMISNSNKITNVLKNEKEFYFVFDNKYKWSILSNDENDYKLFLYPRTDITIEQLASFSPLDFSDYTDYVVFKAEELKTREAEESFAELYQIVSSKVYGVDDILDDIINS